MPGAIVFDADEIDQVRDAQLLMAGVSLADVERIPEVTADLLLRLANVERQQEWRFLAKLHGAKVSG